MAQAAWVGAEPSASGFIAGQIIKIDHEAGKITLQHEAIPHLRLAAGTTTFRYVESKWLIGRRAGDRVRFRADRIDLSLRMTALIYIPGGRNKGRLTALSGTSVCPISSHWYHGGRGDRDPRACVPRGDGGPRAARSCSSGGQSCRDGREGRGRPERGLGAGDVVQAFQRVGSACISP